MASLSLDLFRSCKTNKVKPTEIKATFAERRGSGTLFPLFVGYTKTSGEPRDPDVTTFAIGSDRWVRGVLDRDATGRPFVRASEGGSLNDTDGNFGFAGWYYFLLPEGTEIPPSLDVVQSGRKGHYVIRCRVGMSQVAYEGALNNLARSAIARSVELGKSSLSFEKGEYHA